MEAVAWTAIGVLAAAVIGSFGSFFYLGTRVDALGARLGARIDAQGVDLGARIDALTARVDHVGTRLDELSARVDDHIRRHAG